MTFLDWIVIVLYLSVIVTYAVMRGKTQRSPHDYYLAGRKIRWWQSGTSTMATQLGAISFVSAPAFVAMKEGGGLKWLCYEFGVPLGLILVMILIIPILHRRQYISIYEYLEDRFDRGTRNIVSVLFQLGRGLATAVSVLAGGIILSTALPLTTVQAIVIIGAVTIIYDAIGGIRVVIFSDLFQMLIIIIGIGICGIGALWLVGWDAAWQVMSPDRLKILDFKHWGFSPEGEYAFWPMALGGIFLYASYYGCDQSQVQRELSVKTVDDVKKSLLVNAFGRFPVVLLYCVMGVLVGAVFTSPELLGQIAAEMRTDAAGVSAALQSDPDRMVPIYILTFMPPGIVGFIFVAILSALMSSLDSAINSLSAVTMQDFYKPYFKRKATERHYLVVSKIITVAWGIFCVLAALVFATAGEATRQTTIVLINAVGSLLYGPILAAFVIGITSKLVKGFHIKAGVILGIAVNLVLWQLTSISWLWWNVAGFLVAVFVSTSLSYIELWIDRKAVKFIYQGDEDSEIVHERKWTFVYFSIIFYFFLIIFVSYIIQATA
jgi:SSS family transporter